jgi:hypothetical protein
MYRSGVTVPGMLAGTGRPYEKCLVVLSMAVLRWPRGTCSP